MNRARLPNRLQNETATLTFAGTVYRVTVGFNPDGRPGEVFADGAKPGSMMDALLADASVTVSLLLQHGVEPAALAHSMGRLGDGTSPASILGALADLLAGMTAATHGESAEWPSPGAATPPPVQPVRRTPDSPARLHEASPEAPHPQEATQ